MAERKHAITVYDFLDYRGYLRSWVDAAPVKRGQLARLSEAANVHKTTLSQIFQGTKELSLEQAHRVSLHLGHGLAETEHFLLLVNYARAGSTELRESFRRQIENRRKSRLKLSERVTRSRDLSSEERAIFYSNWMYSAIRNVTAIESCRRRPEIHKRLGLDREVANGVIEFLLKTRLCIEDGDGLRPGPQMTHLEDSSPLVSRHHGNWRVKAMERHPALHCERELAYTAPMTLSEKDALRIRALLAEVVQSTDEIVAPSPSEKLYCMCLDWFEIK